MAYQPMARVGIEAIQTGTNAQTFQVLKRISHPARGGGVMECPRCNSEGYITCYAKELERRIEKQNVELDRRLICMGVLTRDKKELEGQIAEAIRFFEDSSYPNIDEPIARPMSRILRGEKL